MKKYIITLIILLVGQLYPLTDTEHQLRLDFVNVISQRLQNASDTLFGGPTKDVFKDKKASIDQKGLEEWFETIDGLKSLIDQYNVEKNPVWNDYFDALQVVNDDLLSTIKKTLGAESINNQELESHYYFIIDRIKKINKSTYEYKPDSRYSDEAYDNEAKVRDIITHFGMQLKRIALAVMRGIDFAH